MPGKRKKKRPSGTSSSAPLVKKPSPVKDTTSAADTDTDSSVEVIKHVVKKECTSSENNSSDFVMVDETGEQESSLSSQNRS